MGQSTCPVDSKIITLEILKRKNNAAAGSAKSVFLRLTMTSPDFGKRPWVRGKVVKRGKGERDGGEAIERGDGEKWDSTGRKGKKLKRDKVDMR